MTNKELQALAEELADLDPNTDGERVRAIETQIVDYECGLLKNSGGKAYFPLLMKHNTTIPFDDFWDIFTDVLFGKDMRPGLLKTYRPEKAAFTTALTYFLNMRVKDYWTDYYKKNKVGEPPSEGEDDERQERLVSIFDEDGEVVNVKGLETEFPDDAGEELLTVMRVFVRLASLVIEQKKLEAHGSKKMWFERFFTFDLTKTVKDDPECAEESIVVSAKVFPIMEIILLKYLMYGEFYHMRDVVANDLQDKTMLERRNEAIRKCYGVSKTTVVNRNIGKADETEPVGADHHYSSYRALWTVVTGIKPPKRKE